MYQILLLCINDKNIGDGVCIDHICNTSGTAADRLVVAWSALATGHDLEDEHYRTVLQRSSADAIVGLYPIINMYMCVFVCTYVCI